MLEGDEEENFLQFSALPVAGATDKGGLERGGSIFQSISNISYTT